MLGSDDLYRMGSNELRAFADRVGVGYYGLDDNALRTKLSNESEE